MESNGNAEYPPLFRELHLIKSYMLRTRVKPDKLELYKLQHKNVWKDVEKGLREAGVVLLRIYAPKEGKDDINMLNMYI